MEKMNVVMCEPGKKAYTKEIGTSLTEMQAVVGGFIEAYYPFDEDNVCIICNEEGKINGSYPCRAIFDEENKIQDIVFGTFFICDCGGDNFASLSEKDAEKYLDRFEKAEKFVRMDNRTVVILYEPQEEGC